MELLTKQLYNFQEEECNNNLYGIITTNLEDRLEVIDEKTTKLLNDFYKQVAERIAKEKKKNPERYKAFMIRTKNSEIAEIMLNAGCEFCEIEKPTNCEIHVYSGLGEKLMAMAIFASISGAIAEMVGLDSHYTSACAAVGALSGLWADTAFYKFLNWRTEQEPIHSYEHKRALANVLDGTNIEYISKNNKDRICLGFVVSGEQHQAA